MPRGSRLERFKDEKAQHTAARKLRQAKRMEQIEQRLEARRYDELDIIPDAPIFERTGEPVDDTTPREREAS